MLCDIREKPLIRSSCDGVEFYHYPHTGSRGLLAPI
uniref:Uncharacterized protein MANES_11G082600 n=1 Tax=Rhizophora mucronata TaxID=61149 RepID=A0A2P2LUD4_RHIMU